MPTHAHGYTFGDILLTPAYNSSNSRQEVDISSEDITGKLRLELPIMSAPMDTITESAMANFMGGHGGIGVLHRFCTVDKNVAEYKKCQHKTFVAVGCSDSEMVRAEALRDAGAEYFCIDVAHGHAVYVGKALKKLRNMMPDVCIMAGSVCTYAGAEFLSTMGADMIRCGVGGGSACSTRIKTGHGVPQITAITECARVDRSIVSDGGIRFSGDVVKALAFGADFVMIGGMLAGTEPTPGDLIAKPFLDGNGIMKYKKFRGMASREAQEDHFGSMDDWKTAEGISMEVPYRKDQDAIIKDIIGGLRSGLTYAGAMSIKDLQRKLDYQIITQNGWEESLPHKQKG